MTQVSKPYTFSNGTTADATQVNQDFDTLYSDVDGQLDDTNMKTGGVSKAIAAEGVAPSQSIGLPYGIDVFGSTGFVLSGLTVTKDGTNLNQVNVAAGVAYVLQSSGSANGQLRRLTPTATNYRTSAANSTYYLDLNPDGTYTWGGHSTQTGYVTIATVTSDASSNVNVITDTRQLPTVSWIAPTLQNGWTNVGSGNATAGYYKDFAGVVHVKGIIGAGTTTAGTILFTLPSGYRPKERHSFASAAWNGSATVFASFNVNADGTVTIQAIGTVTNGYSIDLDCVFSAEQ